MRNLEKTEGNLDRVPNTVRSKEEILAEAIRIGDDLLSRAEHDENGLSWKTMSIDPTKQRTDKDYIIWIKSESLYSGVSGIALFFLELFEQTGNVRYLEAATDGMHWVERYCKETPSDFFGFYSGRMGVTYVLSRMYEVTNDGRYLEAALRIAEPCDKFLKATAGVDDLIGGRAGTLLGLLHLFAVTQETRLLEKIDLFIKHLIDHAYAGPQGLYWDHSPQHIHGLCGFSHGAAGIGFVFLEAGRYFQNEALYRVAEQAFLYESYYYNAGQRNWPDFRKGTYTAEDYDEHRKAYREGNFEFFTKPKYMNAWCHGAAGIGLSRLRAYELLKNELYADEAKAAIATTEHTDIADEADARFLRLRGYTLCHAGGGNAEIFLEAFKTFQERSYLLLAEKVALQALATKLENGAYVSGYADAGVREDTSLFMGNAGIGYFYLKLLAPLRMRSILFPKLQAMPSRFRLGDFSEINLDIRAIRKRLLQRDFKRTLFVAEKMAPQTMDVYFEETTGNRINETENFIKFLRNDFLRNLPAMERDRVADVFELELQRWCMYLDIESNSLLYIADLLGAEAASELSELPEHEFKKLKLTLNRNVKIIETRWSWNSRLEDQWLSNCHIDNGLCSILLKKTHAEERVYEKSLDPFANVVLNEFYERRGLETVLKDIVASFETVSPKEEERIREVFFRQIQQALASNIVHH